MRRKKRTYTRRQRALRWLGRTAAFVAVCILLDVIHVLPSQAIAPVRQKHGLGEMELVTDSLGQYAPMKFKRIYLLEDGERLLLAASSCYFPQGWTAYGPGIVMEKDDPEGACGVWTVERDETVWVCLAGFVPDGGEAPEFTMGPSKWERDETGAYIYTGDTLTRRPEAVLSAQGGKCYLEFYQFTQGEDDMGVLVQVEIDGVMEEADNRCATFNL